MLCKKGAHAARESLSRIPPLYDDAVLHVSTWSNNPSIDTPACTKHFALSSSLALFTEYLECCTPKMPWSRPQRSTKRFDHVLQDLAYHHDGRV